MTIITAHAKLPRSYSLIFFVCLVLYLAQGIRTELELIARKPISYTLLEDFGYYERALIEARNGNDPYALRSIGPGYFYPPPALLIVETFHSVADFPAKFMVYTIVNIAIMFFVITGIATQYGYSAREIWYWYILGFGFAPFLELLHLGQINIITLLGIFLLFWALDSSLLLTGFGLSLAILTKVTPIVFLAYLAATKKIKSMISAFAWVALITFLSVIRYGISPALAYPATFRWLADQFPVGPNSQSLISKFIIVFGFDLSHSQIHLFQTSLILYVLCILVISSILTLRGHQPREPLFIVTALGITVLPNVMWYHHYVFAFLPLLVWMAWMRLDPRVVLWCLTGMIIIQSDRFALTDGLLIHLFVHISIISIIVWQVQHVFRTKEVPGLVPADVVGIIQHPANE